MLRIPSFAFAFGLFVVCHLAAAGSPIRIAISQGRPQPRDKHFHQGDDPLIQYTGRRSGDGSPAPRFWQPGIYGTFKIKGHSCSLFVNDELRYGNSHNYLEVIVDDTTYVRLQTIASYNIITIDGLDRGTHVITICKNTEAGIGYIEFGGVSCKKLLRLPEKPIRRMEYIGNSITCGTGMDLSTVPCGSGQWYDQHNAYMSYGPLTSRALHAQWVLSAVSGIGLIHSCCNMKITMPQVVDKIDMRDDSIPWNFPDYVPDVVTICLGQNDGQQDSAIFCKAYKDFIHQIREKYPVADIICLTSPMGDTILTTALKKELSSVVASCNNGGDHRVYKYFFSKQYHQGCGGHPDLKEHQQISRELSLFVARLEKWL